MQCPTCAAEDVAPPTCAACGAPIGAADTSQADWLIPTRYPAVQGDTDVPLLDDLEPTAYGDGAAERRPRDKHESPRPHDKQRCSTCGALNPLGRDLCLNCGNRLG